MRLARRKSESVCVVNHPSVATADNQSRSKSWPDHVVVSSMSNLGDLSSNKSRTPAASVARSSTSDRGSPDYTTQLSPFSEYTRQVGSQFHVSLVPPRISRWARIVLFDRTSRSSTARWRSWLRRHSLHLPTTARRHTESSMRL